MALNAQDAVDRVEQLIALTQRLTASLTADLADFEARRPQDAASRAHESARLANMYRHESARVRRDPSLIAGAPEAARAELKRATQAFEAVLSRHATAVDAVRTVTEGLVQAIAEELAASRADASAYGPRAASTRPAAPALALNRKA